MRRFCFALLIVLVGAVLLLSQAAGPDGDVASSIERVLDYPDGSVDTFFDRLMAFGKRMQPSTAVGPLVDGKVKQSEWYPVYTVNSSDDLVGLDPTALLYVEVVRPANEFPSGAPSTLSVLVQSFHGWNPLTKGAAVPLQLASTTSTAYTYRSTKGLILINNATYEGDGPEVIAVFTDEDSYLQVIRLRP